jgi:hypothetical protein
VALVGVAQIVGALVLGMADGVAASGGPTWWKVDTHPHSSLRGDARADLGIDAADDKSLGYNAVFVTDHDRTTASRSAGRTCARAT